ncbi:hypothetical protein [Rosenbergiella australiborealis]|uniref:hypothetical protein n=1 Tax=Rosenbergiella australiborealis TaxID=1544696 RepID=UPI001F4D384E|nr:hypothetical protein [Rosenbergiella australiborealis]
MVHVYRIAVSEYPEIKKEELKQLIKAHSAIFKGYCLSYFDGDVRYSYFGDSLEIKDIHFDAEGGRLSFTVAIGYYDACKDKNTLDDPIFNVQFRFDKATSAIIFELDESLWHENN